MRCPILVLSRREGQKIFIGDDIVITICEAERGNVRIGIECPREVPIYREEVKVRIDRDELDRKLGH
jgi:carbon storage regulator